MSKRAGGKFTSSHSTIIEAAEVVADTAAKQPEVSKISLGMITGASSKNVRLKFRRIQAGWEVIVYGKKSLQSLYIYTADAETTKQVIENAFG